MTGLLGKFVEMQADSQHLQIRATQLCLDCDMAQDTPTVVNIDYQTATSTFSTCLRISIGSDDTAMVASMDWWLTHKTLVAVF